MRIYSVPLIALKHGMLHEAESMKVWLSAKAIRRRWWFGHKTVYYVNTEFMSQGPYETVGEALEQMNLLKWAEVQS